MVLNMELVTIKENKDFRRVYMRGSSYASGILVTYVIRNRSKITRIGITTGKKIGKAVLRNRSRRIIREAFREISDDVKTGYDIVIVARPAAKGSSYFDIEGAFLHLCRLHHLIADENSKD